MREGRQQLHCWEVPVSLVNFYVHFLTFELEELTSRGFF